MVPTVAYLLIPLAHINVVARYTPRPERGDAVDGCARRRYAVGESLNDAVTRYSTKGNAVTRYAVYRITCGAPRQRNDSWHQCAGWLNLLQSCSLFQKSKTPEGRIQKLFIFYKFSKKKQRYLQDGSVDNPTISVRSLPFCLFEKLKENHYLLSLTFKCFRCLWKLKDLDKFSEVELVTM